MRAVVQRVLRAVVHVEDRVASSIDAGLLVYLGVAPDDSQSDVDYLADKVRHLRIFEDDAGKLNLDVVQAGGQVMVVSAFTVQADARRGRRPGFDAAARPEDALALYDAFCDALGEYGVKPARGCFGEYMAVESTNDGPICILLDSRRTF